MVNPYNLQRGMWSQQHHPHNHQDIKGKSQQNINREKKKETEKQLQFISESTKCMCSTKGVTKNRYPYTAMKILFYHSASIMMIPQVRI